VRPFSLLAGRAGDDGAIGLPDRGSWAPSASACVMHRLCWPSRHCQTAAVLGYQTRSRIQDSARFGRGPFGFGGTDVRSSLSLSLSSQGRGLYARPIRHDVPISRMVTGLAWLSAAREKGRVCGGQSGVESRGSAFSAACVVVFMDSLALSWRQFDADLTTVLGCALLALAARCHRIKGGCAQRFVTILS
jgi:hypothetical protein